MITTSLADSFRIVDLDRLLFGIEAAGTPHLQSLLAARIGRLSDLKPHRVFDALSVGGQSYVAGGVAVFRANLPDFGGLIWTAARLVTPIHCHARDGAPVDLAFAVVGSSLSVTARRAARSFQRLSNDRDVLFYLRAAGTIDLFRAELTSALERLDYREPVKMTG